ncbi:MAG: HAD family hydrolase [Lentisphaeria bacterium]|nr:HAD family hydrolase [Lentisphaeria bacterium]
MVFRGESLRLPIGLVCTDFDGTLFDGKPDAESMMAFKNVLDSLRDLHGARWAIVTGRPLSDLLPMLGLFMTYRLFPDLVVVADALIFKRNILGKFKPFHFWNAKVALRRHALVRKHAAHVTGWRDHLMRTFPGVRDRSGEPVDIWLDFQDEAVAESAENELLSLLGKSAHRFLILRWGTELFLAPAAGTKGEAVERLAKHCRVPMRHVFAVGDGPNDLPMLREGCVGMPACVGNASERVKQAVGEGGGYLARGHCLEGVLEALWFYAGVTG